MSSKKCFFNLIDSIRLQMARSYIMMTAQKTIFVSLPEMTTSRATHVNNAMAIDVVLIDVTTKMPTRYKVDYVLCFKYRLM